MEISAREATNPAIQKLSNTASACVKTLLYFDIFNYPLTRAEIGEYSQIQKNTDPEIEQELQKLIEMKCIQKQNEFYFIANNIQLVERRKKGNAEAAKKMVAAKKMSNFISNFPFVESVCISGSLSKNYMDSESDIDFFIITTPHRLWLCRGLLVIFKKVFLFNSRKHFCINYYLDTENLEIPDRNLFTATEISFLIPTYNHQIFKSFEEKNLWCAQFYPNKPKAKFLEEDKNPNSLKRAAEWMLNGYIGERLDAFFFRLTLLRWKKKFAHFSSEDFDLNLRSRKNVSKHHPRGYQKIVLESFQKKILNFEMQYNVKLQ